MSRYPGPCLCGDPHCPSCGPLIGGSGICASCEGVLPEDYEEEYCEECLKDIGDEEPYEDPVQADADVLRSAGMGTDEDYGYFGDNDEF